MRTQPDLVAGCLEESMLPWYVGLEDFPDHGVVGSDAGKPAKREAIWRSR